MELEKLFGLPAHPLLVHVPVVLVPLAAIIAVVFAFRPAWLDRFGWGLVALSGVGALGAILAAGSGEGLRDASRERSTAALEDHAELGELARTISIIFFVIVTVAVVLRYIAVRRRPDAPGVWAFVRSKGGAIVIAAALVVSAGGAFFTIAKAGHQGAKITWEEEQREGGGDDDGG